MIVRMRSLEFLNLAHAVLGRRNPDGGMQVFMRDAQPLDLPPDDADRIRRRLAEIDPEPLAGERPPGPREEATGVSEIREPRPRRSTRGGGGAV